MTTTGDELVRAACAAPADPAARAALADWLAQRGDDAGDTALAARLADPATGPRLVRAVWRRADRLRVAPGLVLLRYAGLVAGRSRPMSGRSRWALAVAAGQLRMVRRDTRAFLAGERAGAASPAESPDVAERVRYALGVSDDSPGYNRDAP